MPPRSRDELIKALMKDIDPAQDTDLYNETLQAFEAADDKQLSAWYNQQNDPALANENAWTSAQANEKRLKETDLNQPLWMSEEQRDAVMSEISHDVDSLTQELTLEHDTDHEHER